MPLQPQLSVLICTARIPGHDVLEWGALPEPHRQVVRRERLRLEIGESKAIVGGKR